MRTNRRTGTRRQRLIEACRRYELNVTRLSPATITDIDNAIRRQCVVIVNYREPSDEESHYALVNDASPTQVVLCDPWHGPKLSLPTKEFMRRWAYASPHDKGIRWAVVVSGTSRVIPAPVRTIKRHVSPIDLANQFLYHEFLKIFRDIKRPDFRRAMKTSVKTFIKRDGLHHYWLLVAAIAEGWRVKSVYRLLTNPGYAWRLERRRISDLTMTGFSPRQVDNVIFKCHRNFYEFADYYRRHRPFFRKYMPNLAPRPERDHHPVFVYYDKREHTLRLFDGMRRTTLAAIAGKKTIDCFVGYATREGKPMANLDKIHFFERTAADAPKDKRTRGAFVRVGREITRQFRNGRAAFLSTLKPWSDADTKSFLHAITKR